ncbi:hypothetical protein NQ318_014071 [Aromia moschata]|uniref:Uncharacterized protein n=1 Tax=Aromia moschata TaxID=1265417 RepID=A0AAV8Z0Y3_9CUCU|nr:hypothetical protein NQ318_014071 [Aromia moschata]
MGEDGKKQEAGRSQAMALMRFFSVESADGNEVQDAEMLPLDDLWCKEFALKVVQLPNGISYVIITGVIILSSMLGCAMRDVLIRIFNILGMILYFSAATVIFYECLARKLDEEVDAELTYQRKWLFTTSVTAYFNAVVYAVDVFFSVKKAINHHFACKYVKMFNMNSFQ